MKEGAKKRSKEIVIKKKILFHRTRQRKKRRRKKEGGKRGDSRSHTDVGEGKEKRKGGREKGRRKPLQKDPFTRVGIKKKRKKGGGREEESKLLVSSKKGRGRLVMDLARKGTKTMGGGTGKKKKERWPSITAGQKKKKGKVRRQVPILSNKEGGGEENLKLALEGSG